MPVAAWLASMLVVAVSSLGGVARPVIAADSILVDVSPEDSTGSIGAVVTLTGGNGASLLSGGQFLVTGTLSLAGEIDWHDGYLSAGSLVLATNGLISVTSSLNHLFSGNV